MIADALCSYLGGSAVVLGPGSGLRFRVNRARKGLLSPRYSFDVDAILTLAGTELNFQQGADALLEELAREGKTMGQVGCRWIVCSDRGGIYLYEALATKENRRYRGMSNRFMVLDPLDGTISFGPGHLENRGHSEALRHLIDSRGRIPEATWNHQFDMLLGHCLAILRNG